MLNKRASTPHRLPCSLAEGLILLPCQYKNRQGMRPVLCSRRPVSSGGRPEHRLLCLPSGEGASADREWKTQKSSPFPFERIKQRKLYVLDFSSNWDTGVECGPLVDAVIKPEDEEMRPLVPPSLSTSPCASLRTQDAFQYTYFLTNRHNSIFYYTILFDFNKKIYVCQRKVQGGGIGMGSTCKSKADSCQCMTKTTTIL